jgi:protein-arginine kinase activator protein McsA
MQCQKCKEEAFVIYTVYIGDTTLKLCRKCMESYKTESHHIPIFLQSGEIEFKTGDFIE